SLDLQGATGNLASLDSYSASNPAELILSGGQAVAYAQFTRINASFGLPIDAGDNCVDGGSNTNVNFTGVKYWDGGGSDTAWSTPENWSGDTAPIAGQDVIFGSFSAKDCTIGADASVGHLTILTDYAGDIDLGT